jgi:transcription elongation factor Elf1
MSFGCPFCGEWVDVSEDLEDYTWKGQTGKATTCCPECGMELQLEAEGYIDYVTCITKVDELSDKEAYLQHCDELIDLQRDREMGIE